MSNIVKLNKVDSARTKVKIKISPSDFTAESNSNAKQDLLNAALEKKYEDGLKTGYENAARDLHNNYVKKIKEAEEEFRYLLEKIDNKMIDYEKQFEQLVVNLSLEVSKKIVRREIRLDSPIETVLREAMRKILGANNVKIKIHPDDLKKISNYSDKSFLKDESFDKIKFEEDERIEQGGCVIETEIGNVDSRISTQLNELKRQFELTLGEDEE